MKTDVILKVDNVTKTFGQDLSKTEALRGISFDVLKGEFLGIMGASGSGKTTLLNCIATMTKPSSGKILLGDDDLTLLKGAKLSEYRGSRIGYLFQDFELLDNMTARENIILPLSLHGITEKQAEDRLRELAEHFDITDVLDKFVSQMSGGQKQRTAAARALISEPDILLMDEPTGALDSRNSKIVLDKLRQMNTEKKSSIVMVTHDARAASYCSRVLFIRDGRLFHELRRSLSGESQDDFYEKIITVTAQMAGGNNNVI
ncbi:MAG: ABC transporter ATP-binding protein [Oscillospiraceae bacterium]|nr:ABC transporter ATP-binding protein [Oscillospiraceae bacterium]